MVNADVSRIFGRVKLVTSAPDYTVQVLHAGGKLRVQKVNQFAMNAGQWQIVGDNEDADFRIQVLPAGAQFTITWVTHNPGVTS